MRVIFSTALVIMLTTLTSNQQFSNFRTISYG
jgi:hypothetical protein